MRPESPTYLQSFGTLLSAENLKMLFVPRNVAHGFLTLEPDTAAYYLVGEYYTPEFERGVRYDDPMLGIDWPAEVRVISEKDRSWPLLK
jgi:dTDP-4-dehydrorhamnose 3,5-epimerase